MRKPTFALAALLAACSPTGAPGAPAPEATALEVPQSGLETVPLTISSQSGVHRFTVEVARTPEEQAQGLMHRQSLAPDRGMIFPYETPRPAAFWMKNTLIPLDMIFIGPDRQIIRIAENTVPLSLDPVPSIEPVSAVLEIAGGRSAELGLKPGDRVDW